MHSNIPKEMSFQKGKKTNLKIRYCPGFRLLLSKVSLVNSSGSSLPIITLEQSKMIFSRSTPFTEGDRTFMGIRYLLRKKRKTSYVSFLTFE